jgi:glycosyltransferase involved in cell wall biosynthesis
MTHIAVIIPALNEAGNIGRLVTELVRVNAAHFPAPIPQYRVPRTQFSVIVVDNGSTDATADEARGAGAQVVGELRRGYGYACAAGVSAAAEGNADVLVFIDGDFSSLPAELPAVLAPILADEADLVLGSRSLGHIAFQAMLPHQRFGNWLASRLMNLLYGLTVTDLGPYRAIRRSLLDSLDMRQMTYGWPTEMMVKAAQRGARVVEVPVSWHPRQAGRSKVSGTLRGTLLATWYILGVTLRYAWRKPADS